MLTIISFIACRIQIPSVCLSDHLSDCGLTLVHSFLKRHQSAPPGYQHTYTRWPMTSKPLSLSLSPSLSLHHLAVVSLYRILIQSNECIVRHQCVGETARPTSRRKPSAVAALSRSTDTCDKLLTELARRRTELHNRRRYQRRNPHPPKNHKIITEYKTHQHSTLETKTKNYKKKMKKMKKKWRKPKRHLVVETFSDVSVCVCVCVSV